MTYGMKQLITLLWAGVLALPMLMAQDVRKDIDRINATYEASDDLKVMVEIRQYDNVSSREPSQITQGTTWRSGKHYYAKMGKVETLTNDNFSVLVDHTSRALMIQPPVKQAFEMAIQVPVDSMLVLAQNISFDRVGKNGRYTFQFEGYVYDRIELLFDPQTYLLTGLVYITSPVSLPYADTPQRGRLEVRLSDQQLNPDRDAKIFSGRQYVQQTSTGYKPVARYASYEFINYLSQE